MKSDPNRGFFCFDWEEDNPLVIYGTETADDYDVLEMAFLPCNMLGSDLGKREGEFVSESCNESLEEQIKYVGQSHIQILVNKERFMPEEFGDDSV